MLRRFLPPICSGTITKLPSFLQIRIATGTIEVDAIPCELCSIAIARIGRLCDDNISRNAGFTCPFKSCRRLRVRRTTTCLNKLAQHIQHYHRVSPSSLNLGHINNLHRLAARRWYRDGKGTQTDCRVWFHYRFGLPITKHQIYTSLSSRYKYLDNDISLNLELDQVRCTPKEVDARIRMANSDLATLEASQGAQSSTLDALILPPDELLSGQGQIGHEMVADFCQSLGSTEPEVCTRDTAIGDKDPTPGPVSDLKANDRPIEQIMHDINVTAGRSEIIRSKDAEMHAAESAEQCKLVEHSAQSGFQNEISGSPQSFESTVPALPVVPDLKQSIVDPDTIMEEFWKTWSRMYDTQTLNHSKTIKSSLVANSPESAEALHCSVAAADEANKAVQTRLLFRFPSKVGSGLHSLVERILMQSYSCGPTFSLAAINWWTANTSLVEGFSTTLRVTACAMNWILAWCAMTLRSASTEACSLNARPQVYVLAAAAISDSSRGNMPKSRLSKHPEKVSGFKLMYPWKWTHL